MAKVVICPSCQAKGAIPDDAQVARIRCPKCGFVHRIGGEASAGAGAPPSLTAASLSSSAQRRVPPAAGVPPPPAAPSPLSPASHRVVLFALLGVSGLVVVLLGVIVALLLVRGGGAGPQPGANVPVASAPECRPPAPVPPRPRRRATWSSRRRTLPHWSSRRCPPRSPLTPSGRTSRPPLPPRPPTPRRLPTGPAPPDEQEVLRRLKDATVLINSKIGKKTIGNGSGFVIEVNGDSVLLGTNRHVAVMEPGDVPPQLLSKGAEVTLEAVFRSGTGATEQALPARIIAADMSGELSTDLAFLVVRGVKNPPKPLVPSLRVEPIEGMRYLGAGFPLAGVIKISENEGKPSVVVTGGRIASFRRDEYGQLLALQVDGSLQPGNSGGPIVNEKTGKLLGVAVAKASFADTIGFIVPADQVRKALGGRVGGLLLTLEASPQGTANLRVRAILVDPKVQVAGVVIHAAPLSAVGKLSPNADGSWPALPNTRPTELQRNPRAPEAIGRVQVALSGSGAAGRKVLIQAAYRDMRGRLTYTRPKEVFLPDTPGPIRDAGSLGKIANRVMAKSLALLGPLVDPSKDCRLDKDDRSLKVHIDIPGKVHTLGPDYEIRKNVPIHNAPMTLTDVEGDFLAQVEVTGELNPGLKLPNERLARGLGFTFQSGGLLLYQDKNNFIRLERAGSIVTNRATMLHRLVVEVVRDGKWAINPIWLDIPEGDTRLILSRRKGRIRCMFGPAGTDSIYRFRDFASLNFPSKVKVGLTASNISAQPFTANFTGFALLGDGTQIDRELDGE